MASNESHILVINSGSSSLKFTVFDPASEAVLASGIAERLGTDGAGLKLVDLAQQRHNQDLPMADHRSALFRIIELLTKSGRFGVKAIGHRVVHGGEYFQEAVIVTEDVIGKIEELARLAPLHNRPNAQGIRIAAEIFSGKPQVAVFDTGFHQTLPPYAFHYPIPYEYYERHRVRRYGFHGTSHHYVTNEIFSYSSRTGVRTVSRTESVVDVYVAQFCKGLSKAVGVGFSFREKPHILNQ